MRVPDPAEVTLLVFAVISAALEIDDICVNILLNELGQRISEPTLQDQVIVPASFGLAGRLLRSETDVRRCIVAISRLADYA